MPFANAVLLPLCILMIISANLSSLILTSINSYFNVNKLIDNWGLIVTKKVSAEYKEIAVECEGKKSEFFTA